MTDQEHDEPTEGTDLETAPKAAHEETETLDTEASEAQDADEQAADAQPEAADAEAADLSEEDDPIEAAFDDDPIEAAFDDDDFDDATDTAASDGDDDAADGASEDASERKSGRGARRGRRGRRSRASTDDRDTNDRDADDSIASASDDGDADGEDAVPAEPEDPPEIPLDQIDTDALWVVRRLRAKGHEAYLTGGCVRDLLLGREPKDFDVATAAHPDEVKKVFRNCRLIGRRFRLAHITFPGGKVIETATFRANPNDDADEEELEGDLLVERDNVFGTVEEDARRRDLTINGLFYDPIAGKVLDFVDGRQDLDARFFNDTAATEIRFQEDPVRILRAIKFATRLGFDFEEATAAAMKHHVEELVRCAPARLQDEIQKLLLSGHAQAAFALCEKFGVIEALMPELLAALNDGGLEARELNEDDQEAYREEVRRERRVAAKKAAAEAKAAEDAARAAEAPTESPTESPTDAAADDAPAAEDAPSDDGAPASEEPEAPAAEAAADDGDVERAEAEEGAPEGSVEAASADAEGTSPEAATSESEAPEVPEVPEEPIEVPTHGAAPLAPPERRQRLEGLLAALDQVRSREVQIASSVALGALLLPAWEAMRLANVDEDAWLDGLGASWTERLRMTRRDRETIQRLVVAMEELRPARRFGQSARSLVGRPWFREALLLYTLVLVTEGGALAEIGAWKAIAQHYERPYKQPRVGERDPKPRRSRRRSAPRGRSRRRGGR